MKKRGVSPVIATVLLIALVTAAAAIVFLVVLPMVQNPGAQALITPPSEAVAVNDTAMTFNFQIKATGGDITVSAVSCSPSVTLSTFDPVTISKETTQTVSVTGLFTDNTEYTITFTFTSGDSSFTQSVTVVA
ncbi:MAG: archaellin/type IV pilin N-terminal domain-containing protein [Candidatus Heimdallarchaeaceae archaeon]